MGNGDRGMHSPAICLRGKVPGHGPAEGNRKGIGGIEGDGLPDAEKATDHPADLLLGRGTEAGSRLLDLLGAEFVDGQAMGPAGDDGGSPRLSELERGGGVPGEEDVLHGSLRGPVEPDHLGQLFMDPVKAVREGTYGVRANDPPGYRGEVAATNVENSVAGPLGAGVDPENPTAAHQPPNASIASSEMSKFAQTFWTSSDSSSALIRRSIWSAAFPSRWTVDCGSIATSAAPTATPFSSSPFFRSSKRSASQRTSYSCASGSFTTSSAPSSIASSMSFSSATPSLGTVIDPFRVNIQWTHPVSPRLPWFLEKRCRMSATVRFLLSVRTLTRTATPPGPYPSYRYSSKTTPSSSPVPFLIAR